MTASSNQTTLFDYHISSSFIDDSFCKRCQTHQSRPFLTGGVVPAVGMRVEVLMFLKRKHEDGTVEEMEEGETWQAGDMENKVRPFRLSGEIVEVRDPPSLESPPQPSLPENQRRTRSQTRRVSQDPCDDCSSTNNISSQIEEVNERNSTPAGRRLRPATSSQDAGPGRGSLFLADIVRNCIPGIERLEYMPEPTPEMLLHWNEMSMASKEQVYRSMVHRWGAVHGQEIVCEARLNFDYDIRRGNENGPWADLIPVDGRDVYRFTMAYNDQYDEDAWHSIPTSFQNLGRSRNRCWPWTEDHSLPYRRTGADAPVWGNGPGGALQVHVDLGPFLERNVGRRRPNSLQAFAA